MEITVDVRLKPRPLWVEMAQHLEKLLESYSDFGDWSVRIQYLEDDTLEGFGSRLALVIEDNTAFVSLDHKTKTVTFGYSKSEMEDLDVNDQITDQKNPKLLAEVAVDVFDQIVMDEAGEEE